jgi:beta-galactosidase
MNAFNGELTAIVQSEEETGNIIVEAKAKGLKTGRIEIGVNSYSKNQ